MLSSHDFTIPNIYSTGVTADGYAAVTGTSSNASTDGYRLLGFVIENLTGSNLFVQLYDGYTAANAIAGKTPIMELQVAADSQGSFDLGSVQCIPVKKGIYIVASSTQWTFTSSAASMRLTAFWL